MKDFCNCCSELAQIPLAARRTKGARSPEFAMRPICAENSQATDTAESLGCLVACRAWLPSAPRMLHGMIGAPVTCAGTRKPQRCCVARSYRLTGQASAGSASCAKKQRCRLNVEAPGVSHVRSCKGIDAQDTVRCEYEFQIAKPRSCGASHSDYPVRQ
jgi:hypothetical protein